MSRTEQCGWFLALILGIALALGLFAAAVEAIIRADVFFGCALVVAFALSLALLLTGWVVYLERAPAEDDDEIAEFARRAGDDE